MKIFKYDFQDLKIEPSEIEVLLGYDDGSPDPFPELIDEILKRGPQLCEIIGGYIIVKKPEFLKESQCIRLSDKDFDVKKIVFSQLKKADKIAIFVCTAGAGISEYSKKLFNEGDYVKGFVADTIGSVAADKAMDLIQEELRKEMELVDLKITNRYSPGYCDWSVSEQQKLFSFLPKGFCGITLSDTSLMHPIKSVSGFIGIGTSVKFNDYTCNVCDMKDCLYRNRNMAR